MAAEKREQKGKRGQKETQKASKSKTRRSSRKSSSQSRSADSGMSVDALQAIFQRIEDRVRLMIERGSTDTAVGSCLSRAWNENFHRELSAPALRGMVMHYRAVLSLPAGKAGESGRYRTKKTRRNRKQKGGMAPLEYTMGPGSNLPVFGRFPVDYTVTPSVVNSMNRFFESSAGRSCNSVGGHDAPGQAGGGIMDGLSMPVMPMSVPRNPLEGVVSTLQGAPIVNPPASPIVSHVHLTVPEPKPFDPSGLSELSTATSVYKGY
jgi:hypothetical protein